jgi:hypothetical protein
MLCLTIDLHSLPLLQTSSSLQPNKHCAATGSVMARLEIVNRCKPAAPAAKGYWHIVKQDAAKFMTTNTSCCCSSSLLPPWPVEPTGSTVMMVGPFAAAAAAGLLLLLLPLLLAADCAVTMPPLGPPPGTSGLRPSGQLVT